VLIETLGEKLDGKGKGRLRKKGERKGEEGREGKARIYNQEVKGGKKHEASGERRIRAFQGLLSGRHGERKVKESMTSSMVRARGKIYILVKSRRLCEGKRGKFTGEFKRGRGASKAF